MRSGVLAMLLALAFSAAAQNTAGPTITERTWAQMSDNERMAQIVQLRFFAGLSVAETADVLGVSERTVKREWNVARAWLYQRLGEPPAA